MQNLSVLQGKGANKSFSHLHHRTYKLVLHLSKHPCTIPTITLQACNNNTTRIHKGITTNQLLIHGAPMLGYLAMYQFGRNGFTAMQVSGGALNPVTVCTDNFHALKTPTLENIAVLTFQLINQYSQIATSDSVMNSKLHQMEIYISLNPP